MELNHKNTKQILFILCGTILFAMGLLHLSEIFSAIGRLFAICLPVIFGLCLAFVLTPLCEWFEKLLPRLWGKTRGPSPRQVRSYSVVLALLTLAGCLTVFVLGLVPQLREAYFALKDSFPKLMQDTLAFIDRGLSLVGMELPDYSRIDWPKILQTVTDFFQIVSWDQLLTDVLSTAVSVVMTVVDIAIGLFIALRILISRERIGRFVCRFVQAYCPQKYHERIFPFASLANRSFRSFLVGQLKEAFCLGILCCIGMTVLRLPYAVAASVIVGASALIPIVGSWIGGIAGVLLSLTHSPLKALIFLIFLLCLQVVDNNFVYPKIVGDSMRLPSLLVLIAVILGGKIAGVLGMILGAPVCSIAYTLIKDGISRRLDT